MTTSHAAMTRNGCQKNTAHSDLQKKTLNDPLTNKNKQLMNPKQPFDNRDP